MIYQAVLVLSVCVCYTIQQAHPPGVPPPVQQQQHQQQQQQQQQHPEIKLPPPGHGHGRPVPEGFGVNSHDAEHIKEHLKEVVDKPKEDMSEEELEFHYFKLHDYDGNNKLDGTEITKAITHFHEATAQYFNTTEDETSEAEKQAFEGKTFSDDEIANIVDMVLKEDDLNTDGYIEYVEFVTAQRKARGDGNL